MHQKRIDALRTQALAYAAKGWHVFPIRPKTKIPLVEWGSVATSDVTQVKEWWRARQNSIGIATGRRSGVIVLDFDEAKLNDESRAFLARVQEQCKTFAVKTGGGGWHFYFKAPVTKLPNFAGRLPGVDFRGDGGMVVAAPSQHESGNFYEVLSDVEPIDLPKWLYDELWKEEETAPGVKAARAVTDDRRGKLSRATLDFMVNGAQHAHDGTWNHRLWKAARDYHEQGYELEEFLERAEKITGHLDEADLTSIMKSAFSKAPKYEPRGLEDTEEPDNTPYSLALRFLATTDMRKTLRYWQKHFYHWNQSHYDLLPKDELACRINAWMQQATETAKLIGERRNKDILLNIAAQTYIEGKCAPPTWLAGHLPNHLISMGNGLLDPDTRELHAHSPDFFNFTKLPYNFDPKAECPHWLKFLSEIQPDADVRALLQEWFGYNLTLDTSYAKFVLFEGEGANGKSVCCTVLKELLGKDNITAVTLEGFNAERTFPLAATLGKLANIVEELNEVDKAQEGLLKQYVSGGAITVEHKNQDPFTLTPTAKLTFATNVLPRFADRSQGLWRRMLLIPFRFQILDESKQDRRLVTPQFWRAELPGIFNWALEGLRRLKANGYFTEPRAVKEVVNTFRLEMNPAQAFLLENYRETADPDKSVDTQTLYEEYKEWLEPQGHMALSKTPFNREVRRYFKNVVEGFTRAGGKMQRVWRGLERINSLEDLAGQAGLLGKKGI